MATINDFLDAAKAHLKEGSCDTPVVIVTGNDSADLDSIISALLFSFLSAQNAQKDVVYIPLVKVPVADLDLRPEVDFVLRSAGVDAKKLVWLDEIKLDSIRERFTSVKVVLVDHNQLTSPFDSSWSDDVVGVLDHHADEKCYLHATVRHIEMVGSCATLVTLHFAGLMQDKLACNSALSALALAPILVDTIGLRWELGKTTEKDVRAFEILASPIGPAGKDKALKQYLQDIEAEKARVDHLTSRDLLRKDYKEFIVSGFRIGTCSLSWHFAGWAARDGIDTVIQATLDYAKERQLDMVAILTSYNHQATGGQYERELALFTLRKELGVVRIEMEAMDDVGLSRLQLTYDDHDGSIVFYNQKNIRMSRKQIWPYIQSIVRRLPPAEF